MEPFQVIDKYGDNAFKIDLPEEFSISSTFNIRDLTPYLGDAELWTIPSKEGGNEPIFDDSLEESKDNHEERMEAEEKLAKEAHFKAKTEKRSTTNTQTCQPLKTADQQTLQGLSRANLCNLGDMEDRNGISIHGPFYQDPKCLLKITGRP